MIEKALLEEIFDVLQQHYPYVKTFLFEKVPSVKEMLDGESEAEVKLRRVREIDATED